jgi:hypothetical protein
VGGEKVEGELRRGEGSINNREFKRDGVPLQKKSSPSPW